METAVLPHTSSMSGSGGGMGSRDWGHLPAVAVQALGRHCCPASKAKLRLICRSWHDALTNQFSTVFIGPGSAWASSSSSSNYSAASSSGDERSGVDAVCRAFPAVSALHLISSSTRDYPTSHTQDLARLLSSMPNLTHLALQELHELDDFDNLDPASLWDALAAAAPALAQRLVGLTVSGCFWGCPELFGGLRELTGLTQLRLSNNPLETACEVNIIAGLSQLRVLEFGLIFDGSSQHHDVPRALEAIGNLTLLQELSLPMWRRSLGGRAHPLAPSLAAALRQLTQLTCLAVDGKFGHLGVVSHLTNLRRLASAAPLSVSGWEAISKLPQLTLLTSLTPADEPLQLNPARPHGGLDLGLLSVKSCLEGLDVAVMQPEHLASLGQFTRLQRLYLRAASTFLQGRQQALLLTALSCLPPGLTSLTLGPMLPLSPQLLVAVAHSCPLLQSLQARFQAVSLGATTSVAGGAATSAAGTGPGASPVGWDADAVMQPAGTGAAAGMAAGVDAAEPLSAGGDSMGPAAAAGGSIAGMAIDSEVASDADTSASGQLPSLQSLYEDGPSNRSNLSISMALRKLKLLHRLELVLGPDNGQQDEAAGSFQWHDSSSPQLPGSAAAARPMVQLLLGDLPRGLQQLVLAGPFQLCPGSSRRFSSAAGMAAAANQQQQLQQQGHRQQQQQQDLLTCSTCGSAACKLSECVSGLRLTSATSAAARGGLPPQPPGSLGLASAAATALEEPAEEAEAAPIVRTAWDPSGNIITFTTSPRGKSSSSGGGGSRPLAKIASGLKRPGSYSALAHSSNATIVGNAAGPAAAAAAHGVDGVEDDTAAAAAAVALAGLERFSSGKLGEVFLLEELGGLEKRSRGSNTFLENAASQHDAAAAAAGTAAAASATQAATSLAASAAAAAAVSGGGGAFLEISAAEELQQDNDEMVWDIVRPGAGVYNGGTAREQLQSQQHEQYVPVPVLAELCLYKCQLPFSALQQLVQAAGQQLVKLQLLRVSVTQEAGRPPPLQQQAGATAAAMAAVASELTPQQLQQLQVSWGTLQEWYVHPHHLWGLVRSGCFSSSLQRSSLQRSSSTSSSSSSSGGGEPTAAAGAAAAAAAAAAAGFEKRVDGGRLETQPQLHLQLQAVSQLMNLRHLSVMSRPAYGSAAMCQLLVGELQKDELLTPLPLHNRRSMQLLLDQLQAGLQQLPALRQLQLDLGHVMQEQPGQPDSCTDIWTEAGEQLLECMPACQVKHHTPVICEALGGVGGVGVPAAAAMGGVASAGTGAAVEVAGGAVGMADGGVMAAVPGSSSDEEYVGDYVI